MRAILRPLLTALAVACPRSGIFHTRTSKLTMQYPAEPECIPTIRHPLVGAFYKWHRYKARPRRTDEVWAMRSSGRDVASENAAPPVVAALRLSPRGSDAEDRLHFLRSVFVAPEYRQRGFATRLVTAATAATRRRYYCYAFAELRELYEAAGFDCLDPAEAPAWVRDGLARVSAQQSRQAAGGLMLMVKPPDAFERETGQRTTVQRSVGDDAMDAADDVHAADASAPAHDSGRGSGGSTSCVLIVIVQHRNERTRRTATAPLLHHSSLAPHLRVRILPWGGRADNQRLAEALGAAADDKSSGSKSSLPSPRSGKHPSLYTLLWPGGDSVLPVEPPPPQSEAPPPLDRMLPAAAHSGETARGGAATTLVILDGTWQEAKSIFRKGPEALRLMPRLTLAAKSDRAPSSTYRLRGDYGWRRRFGERGGGGTSSACGEHEGGAELMCTAEAAAAVLAMAGDVEGESKVLAVLERFQRVFSTEGAEAAAAAVGYTDQ